MSDLRSVLMLTGSTDAGDIGEPALEVAARLTSSRLIELTVAGTCRSLIRHARELGLRTVDLSATPPGHRRDWLRNSLSGAHIVHALGMSAVDVALSEAADVLVPVVVTFDDSPVGNWRLRRARRLSEALVSPVRWLTHGQVATTRLVHSGVTHAGNVMTLPVLPLLPVLPGQHGQHGQVEGGHGVDWWSRRAIARQRLGLQPGARVVFGVGNIDSPVARRLDTALARASTLSVCFWLDVGRGSRRPRRTGSSITLVDLAETGRLLPTMDVLVTDGSTSGARHPAVDAVSAGVPVIAGTADLASELVKHGTNGFVCDPDDVAFALDAAFAMAADRSVRTTSHRGSVEPLGADELTARCYSAALDRPLVRPVLIGRRTAT
jgi:hypothetical protein